MRLRSDIWVSALLRRCMAQGMFGAVLHKGHEEAGAVFVVINRLDGSFELLVPPPGPAFDALGDRHFEKAHDGSMPWNEIDAFVQKRRRVDADLWLVEIEAREGFAALNVLV